MNCTQHPFRIRIYRDMMLDSTVVCRRALGCERGVNHGTSINLYYPLINAKYENMT